MELFLVPLGWAVALNAGAAAGFGPGGPSRRGPHHPPGNPMPPGAHRHHRPPLDKLTKDTQLMHDTAHIQEDLGRPLEDMSDEELEFHYFKLHDFDNNTLLDGLEMLKAIYHTMDHDHHESQTNEDGQEQKPFTPTEEEMNRYIELIDKVFDEDDLDHDGFLSYPEFVLGRASGSGRTIELAPNKAQIKPARITMEV